MGIDSFDDVAGDARPVHTILLGSEIPIVEHMTGLAGVPNEGGRFFAAPVKIRGFGTFPVRAFVKV